jgi:hypothetical protein
MVQGLEESGIVVRDIVERAENVPCCGLIVGMDPRAGSMKRPPGFFDSEPGFFALTDQPRELGFVRALREEIVVFHGA